MTRPLLARRERHALCDLALALGPDVPTLCDGWTARELVAHLFVRERRPLAAVGIVLPAASGLTDAAMTRAAARDFASLVATVRDPARLSPFALPPVEALANTLEMLVHHEDLRRAQPGWTPRTLDADDLDKVWRSLGRMGRQLVGGTGVPVEVRRSDTGAAATLRSGPDPAVLTGPVVEVTMFLFGRRQVRDLVFGGPDDAVAALRGGGGAP